MNITTVGIDLAKSVFQVHGVDARGQVVLRRQLRREQLARFFVNLPPCMIGMASCPSAHHWGRTLERFGHTVRTCETLCVNSYCFISTIIGLSMSLTRITTVVEGLSVRLLPKCGVFGGV